MRVGFSTDRKSWLSGLIRKLTKSQASHTWLLYKDLDWAEDIVMDAHWSGWRLIPFSDFQKQNDIVKVVEIKHDLDPGMKLTLRWFGTNYDYAGLFKMAFVMFGRWLGRKVKNPGQSARSVFCSEAIVRVLQASKYPKSETLIPEETSPQDLLNFFGE